MRKAIEAALLAACVFCSALVAFAEAESPDADYRAIRLAMSNAATWQETLKYRPKIERVKKLDPGSSKLTDASWPRVKKQMAKSVSLISSKVNGDTATLIYQTEGEKEPTTVQLTKEDGQWKVAYDEDYYLVHLFRSVGNKSTK